MLPTAVVGPVEEYAARLDRSAAGQIAAVYLVGGLALDDFSPRQSNVDLVVVSEPGLDRLQLEEAARAERHLERAGRPAEVWYTTWDELADGPVTAGPGVDTPLTRYILKDDAIALTGPDWPVVDYEEDGFRTWCRQQLAALAADRHGLLVMRRDVASLVLQAARLAQGAASGRVLSKSEAGNSATSLIPPHFRRILHDAVGYRNGAHTSMYWGPFERKYDALEVIRRLNHAIAG